MKFFRFNAGLAAILIAIAYAFAPLDRLTTPGRLAITALIVSEAAILVYWATIGRMLARIRPFLVGTAVAGALVAIVCQAIDASAGRSVGAQTLTIASFISSAALLGGACTAMVLGHWYLVIPSLNVSHLQSVVKLHMASMVARIAAVAAAVIFAIAVWQPGLGPNFQRYMTSIDGIFFWQRVLFGLAIPAVLAGMTWETAKIRSTQSATGILYVDFFAIVVGEVLAKYIALSTRVPV